MRDFFGTDRIAFDIVSPRFPTQPRHYQRFVQDSPILASPELAKFAASHLRDLVALALGADRDAAALAESHGLRAARLHAIKQHIADALLNPNLTIGNVAARHGITPRYVQRLFESEGTTFSTFVLDRRLDRVREMLTDPVHLWRSISTIALEAGFGDISYFNRAFRRRFGLTPNDARREGSAVRPPSN
jgi:AraC-like DNA-binding protein